MKEALVAKAKAAIIKVGGFINRNYELMLIGGLIAAILMHDAVLAFFMVLWLFYAKLSEIATAVAVPTMNITVNPAIVTDFGPGANVKNCAVKKTAEGHF